MRTWLSLIISLNLLLSVIFTGISMGGQNAGKIDGEFEEQKKITQYFYEHDMPAEVAYDRTTKFTAYRVTEEMYSTAMLTAEMVNDAIACKGKAYIIELESTGLTMKYLYCMNKSIVLQSVYELKKNRWVKVRG